MNKEKAVVTGGAGFIGSHIVDALLEKGFDVHIIDNLSGGKMERVNDDATFHKVDIRNLEDIKPIFTNSKYVFHTAAVPRVPYSIEEPVDTHDNNVNGTLNVLVAAKEGGVGKVIYSASSSAYGDQETMPLVETMPTDPKSPYGLQKYIGELKCRLWSQVYGVPTISLRYFNVYGPRLDPEGAYALVIGKFLKQASEGKPITITGDGNQTRDFTHVSDIVAANILASESGIGNGEVFNVGYGKRRSINDLAKLFGGKSIYIEARLEPKHSEADHSKAKEYLGWTPKVTLEDGVAELKKEWGIG